jgi:hypothetical protein
MIKALRLTMSTEVLLAQKYNRLVSFTLATYAQKQVITI